MMIGNVLWSISDVWASVIINRVHKNPIVISWFFGVIDLALLAALSVYSLPDLAWIGWLAFASLFAYLGMLAFFFSLSRVDVSVSSAAWVFMSIGIAIGGMIFFNETLSALQIVGVFMSIGGVLLLMFWHQHVSVFRTCLILGGAGFLYVPFFLIQEAVLLGGASPYDVFYLNAFFHSILTVGVPFLVPKYRCEVLQLASRLPLRRFFSLIVPRSILGLLASFCVILAYKTGYASLVSITQNGQPFFLVLFAWIATRITPKYAPKELLTTQSIGIKILSFCITFAGLSLLVIP